MNDPIGRRIPEEGQIFKLKKRFDKNNAANRKQCPECGHRLNIHPNWVEKGTRFVVVSVEELSRDATGGYWAADISFDLNATRSNRYCKTLFSWIDDTFYAYTDGDGK